MNHPPLQGSSLLMGTVALSLATFMNVLDSTIANVSIPAIAGDLGVSPNQGTWVITSFAVANAISLPLTGWLTRRLGQVRLFVLSVLLFVLTSALCGLAWNLPMLVFFRVLQGAVAGPMIPLSQALLLQSYPKEKAGSALALWAMTTMVAPVLGPIMGGWISDNLSWPWIFYINIPVGLAAAWMTWMIYQERESPTKRLPIDKPGLILLVLWVGSLQILLDKGKELEWFESPYILSLAAVSLVCFCFFLVWEWFEDHPVVDLSLFRRRNFAFGTAAVSLGYGLFFGSIVIMPLWLQTRMGYTATWAGLATAPIGILSLALSPIVGRTLGKVDARLYASAAFILFAVAALMRAEFTTGSDFGTIIVPQIILGGFAAFMFVPLTSILLSGLPPQQVPAASGLANFLRITAGAFGTSISTTLWDDRTNLHHAHLTEAIASGQQATEQTLSTLQTGGMSQSQALALVERQLDAQAAMLGADDFFWISGLLCLSLLVLVWLTQPASPNSPN